jgi:integrase
MKAACSHVFKYAIATGRAESDPTYGLEAALRKFKRGHYASISVDEFPEFLACLNNYESHVNRQTFLALKLLLLTFVRTCELVEARWEEINFEKAMWVVPAERMKMNLPHMVPLSQQSLAILRELKELNANREFIFPGYYNPRRHMCKNTMLVAIKRMGYNGKMTGHGFRSLALGILKEKLSCSHEIADRQLAHVPKSSVDRAYDRALFLPQRIKMMQEYADYMTKYDEKTLSGLISIVVIVSIECFVLHNANSRPIGNGNQPAFPPSLNQQRKRQSQMRRARDIHKIDVSHSPSIPIINRLMMDSKPKIDSCCK